MRRRGLSLLEILIATSIFTVVALAIFALLRDNVNHQGELSARSELMIQAKNAMATIKGELRESGRYTISPAPAPSPTTVSFPVFFCSAPGSNPDAAKYSTYFSPFSYTPPANLGVKPSASDVADANFRGVSNALCYIKPLYDSRSPVSKLPKIDPTTGSMLWDAGTQYAFRIESGSDGVNQLVNFVRGGTFPDGTTKRLLARYCCRLAFSDQNFGPTGAGSGIAGLPTNEIAIDLYFVKLDVNRKAVTLQLHDAVVMRNR